MRQLNLDKLSDGTVGLTEIVGAYLAQAAAFLLEFQGHSPGVRLKMQGDFEEEFTINWSHKIDELVRRNWGDKSEAAEYGAAGIAILLLFELTGMIVVERSFVGTHVDYVLGFADKNEQFGFKTIARLEVSGLGKETPNNRLSGRFAEKQAQVRKSKNSKLPAYVAIVEFSTPKAKLAKDDSSKNPAR